MHIIVAAIKFTNSSQQANIYKFINIAPQNPVANTQPAAIMRMHFDYFGSCVCQEPLLKANSVNQVSMKIACHISKMQSSSDEVQGD